MRTDRHKERAVDVALTAVDSVFAAVVPEETA